MLLRLSGSDPATDNSTAVTALTSRDDWSGHFGVVTDDRIRLRPLRGAPSAIMPGIVAICYAGVPTLLHGAAAQTVRSQLAKLFEDRVVREAAPGEFVYLASRPS